jgi:hypothetical protein
LDRFALQLLRSLTAQYANPSTWFCACRCAGEKSKQLTPLA